MLYICPMRLPLDMVGFVFLQDLPLPLFEQFDQCLEAWPQTPELARVESHRPGQFFLGQFPQRAISEHVFGGYGSQIDRRLAGAGESDRVVPLIGVDDAAGSGRPFPPVFIRLFRLFPAGHDPHSNS